LPSGNEILSRMDGTAGGFQWCKLAS
jgi:hypothetical protein